MAEAKHEEIIKRDDGSRVRIRVELQITFRGWEYRVMIHHCLPRKRTWSNCYDSDGHEYRKLGMEERRIYVAGKESDYISDSEIRGVKLKLWESLKP